MHIIQSLNDISAQYWFVTPILAAFVLLIFNHFKRSFFIFSIITLPATFLHELSHFIVSLITNGQPVKFSLIPHKEKNGYVMGYVASRNIQFYNGAIISLAPLIWLGIAIYMLINNLGNFLIIAYLIEAGIPSIQDIKVAITSLFSIEILIISFIAGFLFLTHYKSFF